MGWIVTLSLRDCIHEACESFDNLRLYQNKNASLAVKQQISLNWHFYELCRLNSGSCLTFCKSIMEPEIRHPGLNEFHPALHIPKIFIFTATTSHSCHAHSYLRYWRLVSFSWASFDKGWGTMEGLWTQGAAEYGKYSWIAGEASSKSNLFYSWLDCQ